MKELMDCFNEFELEIKKCKLHFLYCKCSVIRLSSFFVKNLAIDFYFLKKDWEAILVISFSLRFWIFWESEIRKSQRVSKAKQKSLILKHRTIYAEL